MQQEMRQTKKTFKSLHKELFLLQMLYALKKNKNKDVQNRYPKRITGDKSTLGCGNEDNSSGEKRRNFSKCSFKQVCSISLFS